MLTLLSYAIVCLKQTTFFKNFLQVQESTSVCYLPPEWHMELHVNFDQEIHKVLFIGDVHGCYDELRELLEKAGVFRNDVIMVIFTGDICNKGPKSIETIQLVRQIGAQTVRGNHEEAVLSRLKVLETTKLAKLPTSYQWITKLSQEERVFLKTLPFTISIPALNVIVVHGGLVPGVKLQDQKPCDMLNMRNYLHETLSGSNNIDEGLVWGSQWPGPQFVIFGHDARRRLQKYRHAIGLDTGCLYGGKLTGYMVDIGDEDPLQNGQFISVDACSTYIKP